MNRLKQIIFLTFCFLFLNCCTVSRVNSKTITPPSKSFVKILHTIKIVSCKDNKDKNCPIGQYYKSGSGMAIDLDRKLMTVVTAGHVCDSQPSALVDKYVQTIKVLDYRGNTHQAWVLNKSFIDYAGSGDHCMLWVPTLEVKKVKISTKKPEIGERLRYMGAPLGVYHFPSVAIFEGIFSGNIDASSALVTFPATGGASGSAVLNSKNEIVGILFASTPKFQHLTLITNYKSFKLFIKQTKKKIKEI